jgi:hypothetical protein
MPKKGSPKTYKFLFTPQICADSNSPDINLQFPHNSSKMDVRYNKEKVMDVFYRILAIPTRGSFFRKKSFRIGTTLVALQSGIVPISIVTFFSLSKNRHLWVISTRNFMRNNCENIIFTEKIIL